MCLYIKLFYFQTHWLDNDIIHKATCFHFQICAAVLNQTLSFPLLTTIVEKKKMSCSHLEHLASQEVEQHM